jgi:hypothetical protein
MIKEDFLAVLYSELIPTIRQKHNISTEQALCICYDNFSKNQKWNLSLFVLDEILELDPNNTIFSGCTDGQTWGASHEVFLEHRKRIGELVDLEDEQMLLDQKLEDAEGKLEEDKAKLELLKQELLTVVIRNWMVVRNAPTRSVTDELKLGQRVLILPVMQTNLVREINILERDSELYKLLDKWRNFWEDWSLSPPKRLAKVPPDTVVVEPNNILERDSDLYKLLDDLEGEEEVPELFEGVYRGKPHNQGGFTGEGDYDIVEIESTMKDPVQMPPMMRGIIKAVWLEPENEWDSVLKFFRIKVDKRRKKEDTLDT